MREVFPIVPATQGPLVFMIVMAVVLFGLCAVIASFVVASRHTRFEVSPQGLRIRGDLYGRFIPLRDLLVERARPVDLTRNDELRPRWRTNGAGLPGYASGWFRLANGEKALLFVTDRRRVAYIPTSRGHSLLVSVERPDGFIDALRRMAMHEGSR